MPSIRQVVMYQYIIDETAKRYLSSIVSQVVDHGADDYIVKPSRYWRIIS